MELFGIIYLAITIFTIIIILILTKERFYDKDINRGRPGINLPDLSKAQGLNINFKKFQKDCRILCISFIIVILATCFPMTLFEPDNSNGGIIFGVLLGVMLVELTGFIGYVFMRFSKKADKYVVKK